MQIGSVADAYMTRKYDKILITYNINQCKPGLGTFLREKVTLKHTF